MHSMPEYGSIQGLQVGALSFCAFVLHIAVSPRQLSAAFSFSMPSTPYKSALCPGKAHSSRGPG